MNINSIRFQSAQFELKDWSLVKVTGKDREHFFQGQTTNDLSLIGNHEGQCTARLNRTGKLQSFFFIGKTLDCLWLLCPKEITPKIIEDFEKYIIMDDVGFELVPAHPWVVFNPFLLRQTVKDYYFDFSFCGISARLISHPIDDVPLADEGELERIRILNGWPKWGVDVSEKQFINDTFLNQIAISYKKGCFLGQETVAKIENNRGASYYPVLVQLIVNENLSECIGMDFEIENRKGGTLMYQVDQYLQLTLFRDFRIIGRQYKLMFGNKAVEGVVKELPLYSANSRPEIARELYYRGGELFQQNKLSEAKSFLEHTIVFDPSFADAYESLGVILGREGRYEEAIEWMEKLLSVDQGSVMAHTNKSLYLMKLGKIEEAEAEKSLATVKSFAMFGTEAKLKKQLEEEKKKKDEEISRREKMFKQVLEIDAEDTIALYGMADIHFYRKEFQKAVENLQKVLSVDTNYSNAYLLLGKSHESLGETDKAQTIYKAGILIASKQGDMMPANEMQSRLNQLVMGPGFL